MSDLKFKKELESQSVPTTAMSDAVRPFRVNPVPETELTELRYQMGLRPQTLYGIADSPVGLAAYFLDHDAWSYALISRVFSGEAAGLTRDDVLDNITITWLTNTAISGARLYWENKFGFFSVKGFSVPAAVSAFPDELYQTPRNWAEQAYPKLIHYNKLDKGGHFAAWEQPQLLSEEVRAGFRSVRNVIAAAA